MFVSSGGFGLTMEKIPERYVKEMLIDWEVKGAWRGVEDGEWWRETRDKLFIHEETREEIERYYVGRGVGDGGCLAMKCEQT